jgi:hypothetical protein
LRHFSSPPAITREMALWYADVTLVATGDGAVAHAHRGVLATYSGVFRCALGPDVASCCDADGEMRLPLPGKTQRELDLLLAWLYPHSNDVHVMLNTFTRENCVSYVLMAQEWDIPLLSSAAERWLLAELVRGRILILSRAGAPHPLTFRRTEAQLAVRILDAAFSCNLHAFVHAAAAHLARLSKDDFVAVLEAPEAWPPALLLQLVIAREHAPRIRVPVALPSDVALARLSARLARANAI